MLLRRILFSQLQLRYKMLGAGPGKGRFGG
jgi:hypothetical protein